MDGLGETTVFAHDASGKLVAEYSTNVVSVQDAKVRYLTADHLGSPRINTDANGAVIARHDYHPFGEEIFTAQRTTGLNYSADSVRKQFTGYERDTETDLDFAQARLYANKLGRFSSTDPILMEPSRPLDPQRINLYGYVRNNPLVLVDPTGQIIDDSSLDDNEDYQKWKAAFLATKKGKKLWEKYNNDRNFKLVVNMDPKKGNGELTHDFKFADGKLIGATISLGSKIDDRSAAAMRDEKQYPLQRALGEERVDSEILGAGVIAHEFGHVEDANERPNVWRAYQDAMETLKARGPVSSEYKEKLKIVYKEAGVSSIDEFAVQTDNRAERTSVPVIQQSLGSKIDKPRNSESNKIFGGQE